MNQLFFLSITQFKMKNTILNDSKNINENESDLKSTQNDELTTEYQKSMKNFEKKCKKCYNNLFWSYRKSSQVIFLIEKIKKYVKDEKTLNNILYNKIICTSCKDMKSGGFHPDYGIVLCANWIQNKSIIEETLSHELIHLYDHLKFNVNFGNLKHHACSEIRASMLSGECKIFNEIFRSGFSNFEKKFQHCIKRRAAISVSANPSCNDLDHAKLIVDSVWNDCFNDTRPFEKVYK